MTTPFLRKLAAEGILKKKHPIHLVGHDSRTYPNHVISACSTYSGYTSNDEVYNRITRTQQAVTCRKCLHLIRTKVDLDPTSRLSGLSGRLFFHLKGPEEAPPGKYGGIVEDIVIEEEDLHFQIRTYEDSNLVNYPDAHHRAYENEED